MGNGRVSVIIPARNELYLKQTIQDILVKASGDIEIVAVLDGYWPAMEEYVNDKRVRYLHFPNARGMRNAINSAVRIATGDYILKLDSHCLIAQGMDEQLKKDCKPNVVIVPRRYRLDPEKWVVIKDGRPPVDYEYLDQADLHGIRWEDRAKEQADIMVDNIISAQGSCWFMPKDYYNQLELLDEDSYGTFFLEFQEISFKAWSSGGIVVVDKNTWYAHWHKVKSRGYNLNNGERDKAVTYMQKWRTNEAWDKQTIKFDQFINQFLPMPGWNHG